MIPADENKISIVYSRHRFTYQYASKLTEGKIVLDIGCGTEYGCHLISQNARHVTGIDYDSDTIAYCKSHYSDPNIEFIVADASRLPVISCDVIISFQVIEHIKDLDGFMAQVRRMVNPGGWC